MKKHNLTAWMIVMAIPIVSMIAGLFMWFEVYRDLSTLKPDTKRSIGKDILLSLVTLCIFGLFLPYLLMKEMQDGARRVGIEVPNYIAPYYLVTFGGAILGGFLGYEGVSPAVGYVIGMITGPLGAYFFLKPFNIVAEQFGSIQPEGGEGARLNPPQG